MTPSDQLNFHPDFGLPDSVRIKILNDADIIGVRAAAQHHGVCRTVIYKWRKARDADNPER